MSAATEENVKAPKSKATSTRAWLLAALALITPLGLIMVNLAAYVMAHLAAFRVGITTSAVVSTIMLNGIAAVAAFRYGVARWPELVDDPRPQPLVPRLMLWLFSPQRRTAVMVEAVFILSLAAALAGVLTYHGLSNPSLLPNFSTFLGGLVGLVLALPLVVAAIYRRETSRRGRRRHRAR